VGEDAVNGADTLEQLERQNLFVVPLIAIALGIGITTCSSHCVTFCIGQNPITYAYIPIAPPNGMNKGYIEAIQHAVAARSFEYAASLIEQEIQTNENLALMRSSCEMPWQNFVN